MKLPEVQIVRYNPDGRIPEMPTWGTDDSAALDLYLPEPVTVHDANSPQMISMGLIVIPPDGYHTELIIRSSAAKKGLRLTNAVGLIDSDYQGPNDIIHIMLSADNYIQLQRGDRIVQLLLRKNRRFHIKERKYASIYGRKSRGGFGSTNK